MNERLLNYKARRRKIIEEKNIDKDKLKHGSDKTEKHHIEGRKNSDEEIPLCLHCHEFITLKQNSLSVKERKNKKILALKSVLSLYELGSEHLRLIIEKELSDNEQNST